MQGVFSCNRSPCSVCVHNWRILEPRWTDRSDYTYWIQWGHTMYWLGGCFYCVFVLCLNEFQTLVKKADSTILNTFVTL